MYWERLNLIYYSENSGKGTYQIARILTEEGVQTPGLQMKMTGVVNNITNTTDKWNHNTIRRILSNQIYIGNCVQNKKKKISYKSKKMISLPEEEHTITKNHHKPIIPIDKWELVQKMLMVHKNAKIRDTDVLFKGLLYCAHCNNRLSIRTKVDHNKKGDVTRRYILCGTATKKFSNKSCYKRYIKNTINKLEEELKQLNISFEQLKFRIASLYNQRLLEKISEDEYKNKYTNLSKQRKELSEKINNKKNEIESEKDKINTINNKKDILKKIEKIEKKDFQNINIGDVIEKIEIFKNDVIIKFKFSELGKIKS